METGESKHDKFKRIATKRVTNAIKKIEMIGNLSASSYECTEEEIQKIINSLQETLDAVKDKFSKKKPAANKFEL